MTTRIIIADDHPVVLIGVRTLIEADEQYRVVAEARDPDELGHVLSRVPSDLLITDFSMPGSTLPDGHAMLATVRRRYPLLPIILMTMFTSVPSLRMALQAGVRGIVDKGASMTHILQAIARVRGGAIHVSDTLRDVLETDPGGAAALSRLSPKELEVLRLYAAGPTITQIAERLGRTVSTISRQRLSAMHKLGIRNEAELFAYSVEHGLAPSTCLPSAEPAAPAHEARLG